ncbi:ATP-binding protein [Streptomyces sp. NPDC049577]|uniref:ATP-binding protein n=1 Tax=Streptomyces sp. NPDC049577 TaxID=3155153 RepID=UPI003412B23D
MGTGPAGLPPDVPGFTGRDAELRQLDQLIGEPAGGEGAGCGGVPSAALLTGPPGTGKTALAVHWAHRAAHRFPGGLLYATLGRYGEDEEAAATHELMERFLLALGVPAAHLPAARADRAALYRRVLTGRRVLVVLDDLPAPGWIRAFLPSPGPGAVLATSRTRAPGPSPAHTAVRIGLGPLPGPQAAELVAAVAGAERCAAEPGAVRRLSVLCEGLPLALRAAAGRLAASPGLSVRELADALADEDRRLDELAVPGASVRPRFARHHAFLPEGPARLFRRLGLLDLPDFPARAGGVLLGTSPAEAEELMGWLAEAGLLEIAGVGADGTPHFRFPPLLRCYARERAEWEEPREELHRARRRAASLAAEARAGDGLGPAPALHRLAAAQLRRERFGAAEESYRRLLRLARGRGDMRAEGYALLGIGETRVASGLFDEAEDDLGVALGAAERAGDTLLLARVHLALGRYCRILRRTGRAGRHLSAALRAFRRAGSLPGERQAAEELALLTERPGPRLLDLVPRQPVC